MLFATVITAMENEDDNGLLLWYGRHKMVLFRILISSRDGDNELQPPSAGNRPRDGEGLIILVIRSYLITDHMYCENCRLSS